MGLFSVFKKSSNLYFPGCLTYFKLNGNFELYKEIFERLEIDFRVIEKQICCGLPVFEAGYENEARKLAKINQELFRTEGITSIITNSPCCYKMFLIDYPKFLPDWNINVKSIWNIILEKLENNPGFIRNKVRETAVYDDSCYLGRYCEIYEEPRRILKILGYELKEFQNSREESFCCGSCGGLDRTNPEAANEIAREKILQAKRINMKKIIVSSLNDYEILKRNSVGSGVEIMEFSEVLAKALGIRRRIASSSGKASSELSNSEVNENSKINEDTEEKADIEIDENAILKDVENKIQELKRGGR